jgi:hypothetical protein
MAKRKRKIYEVPAVSTVTPEQNIARRLEGRRGRVRARQSRDRVEVQGARIDVDPNADITTPTTPGEASTLVQNRAARSVRVADNLSKRRASRVAKFSAPMPEGMSPMQQRAWQQKQRNTPSPEIAGLRDPNQTVDYYNSALPPLAQEQIRQSRGSLTEVGSRCKTYSSTNAPRYRIHSEANSLRDRDCGYAKDCRNRR